MCKRPCKGLGDLIIDSVMYVSGPSQKTPEWYQERAVRLTGSNWYNILKGKEKPSGLIGCRHGSKFSEMCKAYGDRYEKAALRSVQTFLNPSGLRIGEAKFYIPQSHPFLGATPDGIIVKDNDIDSVVEVKCPYSSRWTGQRPKWIQLKSDGTYGLEPESRYWYQVQAQMFVTGARQCVFGVFTPKMTWIMVVPRDQSFIDRTVHELTVYYVNEYLPYLLDQKIQVPADISLALYLKH